MYACSRVKKDVDKEAYTKKQTFVSDQIRSYRASLREGGASRIIPLAFLDTSKIVCSYCPQLLSH